MNLVFSYLINRRLGEQSKKIFEGIARGRKRALENWFDDRWTELQLAADSIDIYLEKGESDYKKLTEIIKEKKKQFKDFSEIFFIDKSGNVCISSYEEQVGKVLKDFPSYIKGMEGKKLMYGPYIDEDTLKIGECNSRFFDEVTLMFSLPFYNKITKENLVLCGRIPNDVMSDVIQEEDTHIYKESGDNYLFMIKSNRNIPVGTAISRSRFEDNTFTLGDNLKDGIRTKKWGVVQVKRYTEFELIFKDPATGELHQGVKNIINKGESLEVWPGYTEYRHILVGGKGVVINPPHCEEVWGMLCEGDIEEIYKFRSINLKFTAQIGLVSGAIYALNYLSSNLLSGSARFSLVFLSWVINLLVIIVLINKMIVNPLNKTVTILQDIAEGEGDLTKRVDKLSNDEIGELSRWFNKFLNNQMTVVKRIGGNSRDSRESILYLSKLMDEFEKGAEFMEENITKVLADSQTNNSVFQSTEERLKIISESGKHVSKIVQTINENTQKTNKSVIDNNNATKEVLVTMEVLEKAMKNTMDSINILQKYSTEIYKVVNVIETISRQTQLLALNATIESAHAGESGKGFAVVAKQVSKLANESREATVSITSLINNVQSETETTIKNINGVAGKVDKVSSIVNYSIESFDKIQSEIVDMAKNVDDISELINNQSSQLDVIAQTTEELASQVDEDTIKNQGRSEKTLALIQSSLRKMQQVNYASKLLLHSSENLNDIVKDFKL